MTRNKISAEQQSQLIAAFHASMRDFQKVWYRNRKERTRLILKSRQIGATRYFAREALIDALVTGRNQIFLSVSKTHARIFKDCIAQFAQEVAGVKLSGNPMVLPNGAHLYFQPSHKCQGNVYFDEFFWARQFKKRNKKACDMARRKKYRKTFVSSPSSTAHPAYALWSGQPAANVVHSVDLVKIDVSHRQLSGGFIGEDGIWRQIVTIDDAKRGGCDLAYIKELRAAYSPAEYGNLMMCKFSDEAASAPTEMAAV